jgi:hypothetical protein
MPAHLGGEGRKEEEAAAAARTTEDLFGSTSKVTPQPSMALMRTIWKSLAPVQDAAVAGAHPQQIKRTVAKPTGQIGQLATPSDSGHCSVSDIYIYIYNIYIYIYLLMKDNLGFPFILAFFFFLWFPRACSFILLDFLSLVWEWQPECPLAGPWWPVCACVPMWAWV